MVFGGGDAKVYLVPLIDVNWLVYAPFDPGRDFRVDPPKVEQSIGETRQLNREMRDLTGGKFILTPHSGTYCRTGYYEGEMLEVYQEAVAGGAELAVHLHEEIKGQGTRYDEWDHMEAMFVDCKERLEGAGIEPVAYRGGHYAYHPFMNKLLPENGVFIDCSCAPGLEEPTREAIWTHAALSADYLPDDPRLPAAGQRRSSVFEIPIGCDGAGAAYRNLLHVEQSDMQNLARIWDALLARADQQGTPQIIHSLFHTGSVGKPEWIERYREFLEMVPRRGGVFVTTQEAKQIFEGQRQGAAA
jgi:hypothetical protein